VTSIFYDSDVSFRWRKMEPLALRASRLRDGSRTAVTGPSWLQKAGVAIQCPPKISHCGRTLVAMQGWRGQRGDAWQLRVLAGRDPATDRKRSVANTVHGGTRSDDETTE
jgi:hypothetical protein